MGGEVQGRRGALAEAANHVRHEGERRSAWPRTWSGPPSASNSALKPARTDSTMTLAELCRWWLKKRYPTGGRNERQRLELHVCAHALGAEPLPRVTSDRIEELLADVERGGAAPASINRLRSSLHAAFSRARKAKVWTGPNPVSDVETRRVPKRVYNTLRAEEVPVFLSCVDAEWRNLFAAALWTGLRTGELCGLLKSDVDLPGRVLLVSRSYDRDTTKGGHADAIPIAEPLVPYLEDAIRRSTSAYVFPAADGSMRTEETTPQRVLRAALVRAGLVEGWEHVCRRCKANGTPHTERHADSTLRRCDVCGMKMWPRAMPRQMRFHCLEAFNGNLAAPSEGGRPPGAADPAARQHHTPPSAPTVT